MSKEKVRLYELAKKYGMPSKALIEKVRSLGVQVKSHMCIIEDETITLLDSKLLRKKNEKNTSQNIKKSAVEKTSSNTHNEKPKVSEASKTAEKKNVAAPKAAVNKPALKNNRFQQKFRSGPRHKPGQRQRGKPPVPKPEPVKIAPVEKIAYLELSGPLSVKDFADAIQQKTGEVQKALIKMGHMFPVNRIIGVDIAAKVGEVFEVEVKEIVKTSHGDKKSEIREENQNKLVSRPPVVTIMGHVDHGKTSLLDKIRQANVTDGEAGGITQHIGAYFVETDGGKIVFLDTPGHEAFTAMRARGAKVTDIVILVVAADDGVKPQTIEALNHAKDAKVPIIVAVNKIDKPGADKERARRELAPFDIVPEEWGGDTIFVDVSAKSGEGIPDLLEMVLLQTEMMELKGNPDCNAEGVVIESTLDKQRGPVVTFLVQRGTLKVGNPLVCGAVYGKIRAMLNDKGDKVHSATPSVPVEVLGLASVPMVGDSFSVRQDDKEARTIAEERSSSKRNAYLSKPGRVSLQSFHQQVEDGKIRELKLVVKGDVLGSVQAVCDTLSKLPLDKIALSVIHSSVGAITETDIMLASASNAIVIGFNVRPENKAIDLAESEGVDVRLYSVIYNLVDEVKLAMIGMLAPICTEKTIGKAEIREIFSVPKIGKIGGCFVTSGKITRAASFHLIRDNVVIFSGKVASLRRFKEDTKEVSNGYECGIGLENYNDIKVGDVVEAFIIEETKPDSL